MKEAVVFKSATFADMPEGADFSIPEGTLAALVTARQEVNGALVRLILGFDRPDRGKVAVLGREPAGLSGPELSELRAGIGVVHPSGGLVSNLKVWENLTLPLLYHSGLSDEEIAERGVAVLKAVGYKGGLMELPGPLPLFRRRLVGLARAMLMEPPLLLLNGVLAGLSGDEKNAFTGAVLDFHARSPGRTTLFITADYGTIRDIPFDLRIERLGGAAA